MEFSIIFQIRESYIRSLENARLGIFMKTFGVAPDRLGIHVRMPSSSSRHQNMEAGGHVEASVVVTVPW